LGPSIDRIRQRIDEDSTWSEKLHLVVACDVREALVQPFDARGLYQDAVLGLDEFAAERGGIALFHELVEHVIARGQQEGEFADFEPSFVQRAINGVLFEILREQGGPAGPIREARPLQAADFVVRSARHRDPSAGQHQRAGATQARNRLRIPAFQSVPAHDRG
jgi:hypothetical protein